MIDEDKEEGGGSGAAEGLKWCGGVDMEVGGSLRVGATGAGGMVFVGTKLDGSYSSSSSSSSPSSRALTGATGIGGG